MSLDKRRPLTFIVSVSVLLMIAYAISGIGLSQGSAPLLMVGLYASFLIVASLLIAWLTGRLFRQHEMRKLKFDILTMIIVTTLIALPLGINSAIQQVAVWPENAPVSDESRNGVKIVVVALMYFSLVPILFVTEALMVWTLRWRRRGQ